MSRLPYCLPQPGLTRVTGLYPTVMVGGFLSLVLALWVATQVAASAWGYKPALGAPWVWRIYPPWRILIWALGVHADPTAPPVLWAALKAFFVWLTVGALCTFGSAFNRAKRYEAQSDLKGSGKLGAFVQASEHGLLGNFGILLGLFEHEGRSYPLWDAGPEPLLLAGPNRS